MKKRAVFLPLFLYVLFLHIAPPAAAQSSRRLGDPIPSKGNFAIETGFIPGSDDLFRFNDLQTRYLLTDRMTLRLGFEWDRKRNSSNDDTYQAEYTTIRTEEKSNLWGFNAGAQWRVLKDSRVSPYVGFDLLFRWRNSRSEYVYHYYEGYKVKETLEGGWRTDSGYGKERSSRGWRASVVLGSDFYLLRHLYLGVEVGLGFSKTYNKAMERTRIMEEPGGDTETINGYSPSLRSTRFGFTANPAIRLGVWF